MKTHIFLLLFSLTFLAGSPAFAYLEQATPEGPTMDQMRGIDHANTHSDMDDSDPDDWGEGEVILGGDPKANERAVETGKRLAEEEQEWEESGIGEQRPLSAEEIRTRRSQYQQAQKLYEKLVKEGLQEEGWRLEVDGNGNPYLEGPEGERIDPETNPDDWGQDERIL